MEVFNRHFQQARAIIQRRLLPATSLKRQPDLLRLTAAPHKNQENSVVEYAHDPVPHVPTYLFVGGSPFPRSALEANHHHPSVAIRLQPRSADLPYRCSLDATYENRFWRSGLESSRFLLQLLAADRSATDIVVGNGITMATLAQKALRPGMEHRFCKAATYMYPFSDEERMRLLSASMVMMFLFDDKGEETSETTLKSFIDDFVQRLGTGALETPSEIVLQKHIDSIMQGFRKADSIVGNAGQEVIEAMSLSFRRMRPEKDFQTLGQYLEFRHDNVGANQLRARGGEVLH